MPFFHCQLFVFLPQSHDLRIRSCQGKYRVTQRMRDKNLNLIEIESKSEFLRAFSRNQLLVVYQALEMKSKAVRTTTG